MTGGSSIPSAIDEIFRLFESHGSQLYFGEAVTERDHALQSAFLAAQAVCPEHLVVAALLHDLGHLLHGLGEDVAMRGIDARHEDAGEAWLKVHFGPEVTEPVRLHVAAKRYLCAVDPAYRRSLSAASEQSLQLQGGAFTLPELAEFESNPYHADALRLRRCDDGAKVVGWAVPPLEHYRPALLRCLAARRMGSERSITPGSIESYTS